MGEKVFTNLEFNDRNVHGLLKVEGIEDLNNVIPIFKELSRRLDYNFSNKTSIATIAKECETRCIEIVSNKGKPDNLTTNLYLVELKDGFEYARGKILEDIDAIIRLGRSTKVHVIFYDVYNQSLPLIIENQLKVKMQVIGSRTNNIKTLQIAYVQKKKISEGRFHEKWRLDNILLDSTAIIKEN